MMRPKIYYAHCMALYGTDQEKEDLRTLDALGVRVVDPNATQYKKKVRDMKRAHKSGAQIMDYFVSVVERCQGVAFRALPDGSISSGVEKEIAAMRKKGGIIIELPELDKRKRLTVGQTCDHIQRHK